MSSLPADIEPIDVPKNNNSEMREHVRTLEDTLNTVLDWLRSHDTNTLEYKLPNDAPMPASYSQSARPPERDWKPIGDGHLFWIPPTGSIIPTTEVPQEVKDRFGYVEQKTS